MAAYSCVLRAESAGLSGASIERAKLLWRTGKQEAALACLEKAIPHLMMLSPTSNTACSENSVAELDGDIGTKGQCRIRFERRICTHQVS
ncbi:unnamed protein product [Protopolystoma xenopodis]|uniref:Uncharacterized protein n=1 Tax=Protopolystoma xenopodis TaxID=117903 RepID=A0A3S5AZC7_9PLAT|nr:unnamed protein product [Protopolystoma xenopodis]